MSAVQQERGGPAFEARVWRLIRRIPRGRVATYGQLATLLGHPRSARRVGRALRECPPDVPWHRVVNASGQISRRPRVDGMMTQRMRLEQEGVTFRRGRIALSRFRWSRQGRLEPGRDRPSIAGMVTRARGARRDGTA